MVFKTWTLADVSTAEIEETDLVLLREETPCCIAGYTYGAFFWTGAGLYLEEVQGILAEMIAAGLSDKFRDIWLKATIQGIPYLRFDSDSPSIGQEEEPNGPVLDTRTGLERVIGRRRVGRVDIEE
jgi:hypothetical protein